MWVEGKEGGSVRCPRVLQGIRMGALSTEYEFAEMQGGILAFCWGIWLLLDGRETLTTVYHALCAVVPCPVWAAVFLLLGMVQLGGIALRSWRMRRDGALAACVLWLLSALLVGMADWHRPAFPFLLDFAAGSAWGYLRLGVIYRRSLRAAVIYPLKRTG